MITNTEPQRDNSRYSGNIPIPGFVRCHVRISQRAASRLGLDITRVEVGIDSGSLFLVAAFMLIPFLKNR